MVMRLAFNGLGALAQLWLWGSAFYETFSAFESMDSFFDNVGKPFWLFFMVLLGLCFGICICTCADSKDMLETHFVETINIFYSTVIQALYVGFGPFSTANWDWNTLADAVAVFCACVCFLLVMFKPETVNGLAKEAVEDIKDEMEQRINGDW